MENDAATKADLANVQAGLKSDLVSVRTELKGDIGGLRTELKSDITAVRTELKVVAAELREEMSTGFKNLESKIEESNAEMHKTMAQYAKSISEEMRSLVSIFDEKYNHVPKNLQGLDNRFEEHKKDPKAHAGISSAS